MGIPEVVLDTNVPVAGLRSRNGAAFKLLSMVGSGSFGINVSVPLVLEYEAVLLRPELKIPLMRAEIEAFIDFLCAVGRHHEIFFLWRPCLKDPGDDMVLELAVSAGCRFIITFNERDFAGCERFGIQALTPAAFLQQIGAERWARSAFASPTRFTST